MSAARRGPWSRSPYMALSRHERRNMAELLEIESILLDDRLSDEDRAALHGAQQALRTASTAGQDAHVNHRDVLASVYGTGSDIDPCQGNKARNERKKKLRSTTQQQQWA